MRSLILSIHFLWILSLNVNANENCAPWSLSKSTLLKKEIAQQDSGMCYAHRDSKAMEFFHQSLGIDTTEPGVLELSTTFHRKLLHLRQIFEKGVDYKKSESILDWGHSCEAINHILRNGLCEKSLYSSSSYHLIYNAVRMFGSLDLQINNSCKKKDLFNLSNEQKTFYSKFLIDLTMDSISKDRDLSNEEKNELSKFVKKIFSNRKKTNFPKVVKSIERKVKRHCKKTTKVKQYDDFQCSTLFFPETYESKEYKKKTHDYLMKSLNDRQDQAIMAAICSVSLSSTKDPESLSFNDTIGASRCGPHAVLITGAKMDRGSCKVLIEDNYPGICDQEKMPWVECEKDLDGKETGRYWIKTTRLASMLLSVSKIEKIKEKK